MNIPNTGTVPTNIPPNAYSEFSNHITRQLEFYHRKRDEIEAISGNATHLETKDYLNTQVAWIYEIIQALKSWDNRVDPPMPTPYKGKGLDQY